MVGHAILRHGYVDAREIEPLTPSFKLSTAEPLPPNETQRDLENIPGFHLTLPLNFDTSDPLVLEPHVNIIIPSLNLRHMSGGPNTALLFAAYLAEGGDSVRIISCDALSDKDDGALYGHMETLFQKAIDRHRIALIDGFDRSKPIVIGANDVFMATAWWTAQVVKYALPKTVHNTFVYLIQDYEPIFHPASSIQARAIETYGLPHIPVVNTRLLLDHLIQEGSGCYARPDFAKEALFFEPAIDRSKFFPVSKKDGLTKRVLLFYARPTHSQRNLFELGVIALRHAVASGCITNDTWEILAMGEKLDPIELGNGAVITPLPWLSLDQYAERVRSADLLLSLMLSPHPSYPPLEMAASGKLVVTNSCSVKTKERLQNISRNILVAEPTVESIVTTLKYAAARINAGFPCFDPTGKIDLPSTWEESLGPVVEKVRAQIKQLRKSSVRHGKQLSRGWPASPSTDYETYRKQRLHERRLAGNWRQTPGLLSFVTCVYNTNPAFLQSLASSLFLQDGGTCFQWFILDNGSTDPGTRRCLTDIAEHPCVEFERVETNMGIVGGMRHCLERAKGRYILPLDSDDLIEPDCVHVVSRFIHDWDFPALLYTDEDKLVDDRFVTPYFKSDWDPVLFLHSCFIAHLCAIDRERALALGLYTDRRAEGCHDWDSFIRFMKAGYVPRHIPEVLYSWRMHPQSTAGNIRSKSYITASHKAVLQKYLDDTGASLVELVASPLFQCDVDWWFKRKRLEPVSHSSLRIGRQAMHMTFIDGNSEPTKIDVRNGLEAVADRLGRSNSDLIHISWEGVEPDNEEWLWEAAALMQLFPDTAVVGGILHDGNTVLDGPRVFGFGEGCDCPDRGRSLSDPGYSAYMWKQRSISAVSSGHCVVKKDFLMAALDDLSRARVSLAMLGPWLGGLARERSRRVVFSPFVRALGLRAPEDTASPDSISHFLSRFWHIIPDDTVMSKRLSLKAGSAYVPVRQSDRDLHLGGLRKKLPPYREWLNLQIHRRSDRYPLPANPTALSVLTTVYEGTSPDLLHALSHSILGQTVRPFQWIIVAHGPIEETFLRHIRKKAQECWSAIVLEDRQPLGIIGAMQRGLTRIEGEYLVSVDADDVLTADALQILTHEIHRLGRPDLLYSDEDLLVNGLPTSPYFRSSFDPVLNLESSYIWHLCAIKMKAVRNLGLYSDTGATWCHDWDSVMRIAEAGGHIAHVPEVLYHWRQHSASTTNQPAGDPRSLGSVRHVLERHIRTTRYPDRFTVQPWPVNRGTEEFYIGRQTDYVADVYWIGDTEKSCEAWNEDSILLVTTADDMAIDSDLVFKEVCRLFELHVRLGAIGGRVIEPSGRVVEGCFVANQKGELESPWVGHHIDDAGPYALAAKAQSVACTGPSFAFFRVQAIRELAIPLPDEQGSRALWILSTCERMQQSGWNVAYSPLVCARVSKYSTRPSDFAPRVVGRGPVAHALSRYGQLYPCADNW
jgi:glycosyltransferase involved in cell wall biosynthesis